MATPTRRISVMGDKFDMREEDEGPKATRVTTMANQTSRIVVIPCDCLLILFTRAEKTRETGDSYEDVEPGTSHRCDCSHL